MSEIEKISNTISLQEEKESLERKLLSINEKIKSSQSECSHVGVYMGNYVDGVSKCVLCNSKLNHEQMVDLASKGLIIYAHNYLTHENSRYMKKFDTIQTMYLGLCKENKLASSEEIVSIFQEMINRSLNSKVEEKNTTLTDYQEGMMAFMDEDIFKGSEIESQVESKGPVKVLKKDEQRIERLSEIMRKDFAEDE